MAEEKSTLTKKQAVEALQESERRYRELVQNANSAIVRWKRNGTITFFNEYAQEFFGYSEDEIIGKPVNILVPETESTGAGLTSLVQDVISHPEHYVQNINENIRRDGSRAWMAWTNKPIRDENGRVIEILAVGTDITERKRAEEKLQQALARAEEGERMLSALMEYVPEGITMADADLNLIRVSRYGQDLLGGQHENRSVEEVAVQWKVFNVDGKTPMADEDLPLVRAVRHGEVIRDMELVQFNDRGEPLSLLCTAGPIRDDGGQVIGGIVTWRDITVRKKIEDELRQLAHFPEENPNPVLRSDPDGGILYANEPARRWLATMGWRIGGPLPEPVHAAMAEARGQNLVIKTEITDPSGHTLSVSAAQPAGEDYINLYGIDITDRRQAEERIKASLEEKEVLLKEIHHRVKNNMQVISSLVSLQADESQDTSLHAILQDVTHRVRSMAMVHEKLYQSGDLAQVEFDEYAKSLLNYLWRAQEITVSGIRLTLNLEPVSLPVNLSVPCGLILNELVNNALKHAFIGRNSGEVTVSLRHDVQGRAGLCVRDSGIGLPEGFDWRQARTLGLRLVQMLAGQIHAGVEVSSDRKGTRFEIIFEYPVS